MRPNGNAQYLWWARALALSLVLSSAAAEAQDITMAQPLFEEGVKKMQAKQYDKACPLLAESQRLDPRPGTLFTLAVCEKDSGRIATAFSRFGDYIMMYEHLPKEMQRGTDAQRYEAAMQVRKDLQPDLPQLTILLPEGAPAGTVVKRDGEIVGAVVLGMALPVNPGDHLLSVQVPGGPVREQPICLETGEKKVVTLTLGEQATPTAPAPVTSPPPAPPAPPPNPSAQFSRSYVGPIAAFAAGAVGLGIGAGFGAAALSKRSALEDACPDRRCPASQQGTLDITKTFSYVSTAGFVLGGLGVAAGTALLLLPPANAGKPKSVGVRVGAGYVAVEGGF